MERGGEVLDPVLTEWQVIATSALSSTFLVLLSLAIAAAILWTWWSLDPVISKRIRLGLIVLRVLSLTTCLGLLIQPTLRLQHFKQTPTRLAVLIDVSGSMAKGGDKSRLAAARKLVDRVDKDLRALGKSFRISWFRFSGDLVKVDGPLQAVAMPDSVGNTDIRGALASLAKMEKNTKLAGVLLISDGADTEIASPETGSVDVGWAGQLGVPINTVLVGSSDLLKDLAIADVKVDSIVFSRRDTPVEVTLRSIGFSNREIEVVLWQDESVVQRRVANMSDGKGRAIFNLSPSRLGPNVMTVTVPVPPTDDVPENNRAYLSFKVVRDKFRVLHLAGQPSWDQRFLRGALTSWPLVDLVSFYILRTAYQSSTFGSEGMALIPFPKPQTIFEKHLDKFDIVIFQDFQSLSGWVDQDLGRIADFVAGGGAIVLIGGSTGLEKGGAAFGALQSVLPLRFLPANTSARRLLNTSPFKPNLTEVGARHPVMRLSADPDSNADLWRSLTPLDGANCVAGLSPGALSLAEHTAVPSEEGPMPVIAVKQTGKGRALMIASDSLWRWSFTGPMGGGSSEAYSTFWRNAISWLIRDPDLDRLRVHVMPSPVPAGQPAQIELELLDEAYLPVPGAQLSCAISWLEKDGVEGGDKFDARLNDEGRYSREWLPKTDGPYRIEVIGKNGLLASTRFLVEGKNKEMSRFDSNESLLEAIAKSTHGSYRRDVLNPVDLRTSAQAVKQVLSRVDMPLWDHPAAIFLLILFLSMEWVTRRQFGIW